MKSEADLVCNEINKSDSVHDRNSPSIIFPISCKQAEYFMTSEKNYGFRALILANKHSDKELKALVSDKLKAKGFTDVEFVI
ncbi:MAG TPA: hypothetical protein VLB84_02880 [Bacteroidia bacterium]|nr:hypothetical protein [Bacteroidia bacterium]